MKVEKKLPKELVKAPKSVRHFKSWSGVDYYQDEISPLWEHRQVWILQLLPFSSCVLIICSRWMQLFETVILMEDLCQVIRAAKSDSRLANNFLPPDIQKLRCRAFFQALRFAPPIESLGNVNPSLTSVMVKYIILYF